jgi:hypothetical protein
MVPLPRRRVVGGQLVHHLPAEKELEEFGLRHVGGQFHVRELRLSGMRLGSGRGGVVSVDYYTEIPTDMKTWRRKISGGRKIVESVRCKEVACGPAALRGRE